MALLDKSILKAVVLIEIKQKDVEEYTPIATGFITGFIDKKNQGYRVFLVTNKHVFSGLQEIWIRFDKKDSAGTERFGVALIVDGETKWMGHPDDKVDLAMLPIAPQVLIDAGIDWRYIQEEQMAFSSSFEEIGISLGDEVFILGYPMGLSGQVQNYAIVRSGTIARADNEIIQTDKFFLIDANIFPGNSGGPVVIKPEILSLPGTKAITTPFLIGVVSGYKTYQEPLFSHQTNPPTIAAVNIENSGIAAVVPMDYAYEIYKNFLKKNDLLEEVTQDTGKSITEGEKPPVAQASVKK